MKVILVGPGESSFLAKLLAKEFEGHGISIAELKDFAIWMTGCGYDFCQHEYFIKQRDVLLKV